ncbi:hypothetical protein [Dactylosporangium sp. NPDC048998]|uniref:hypothetical protein n=1 Tax=Dactylosporangium sp. NPDC048998 TaxID=3363976 RepID=UPI003718133D
MTSRESAPSPHYLPALQRRLNAIGVPVRETRTAALFQLAVELPAAVLARCLGIDTSSAVAWRRAASGEWHTYAARVAEAVRPDTLPV